MSIRSVFSALSSPSLARLLVPVLAAAAVGGVVFLVTRPSGANLAPTSSPDPLNSSEMRTILAPDAIPAVDHPQFIAADKAGMRDNLNVIGVELGGEAHAFPIPFMSRVEIVNDRLGAANIAVTW